VLAILQINCTNNDHPILELLALLYNKMVTKMCHTRLQREKDKMIGWQMGFGLKRTTQQLLDLS
jgi:hypothetical protein